MKLKTSLIALAVAGTVAVPMAAQAELYSSVRIGVVNTDTGGVSETTVQGVASRFGTKGETDLGNGMTAFGKYEFGVNTESNADNDGQFTNNGGDSKDLTPAISRRHALVGIKGDFGSVTLGQTYHTFYNHVVGPTDIPWIGSGIAMVSYTGRTAEAISYAGSAGAVSFGVTGYLNSGATATTGEEGLDGIEVGASFGIGDMTLGVAMQDLANDDPNQEEAVIGLVLSGIQLGDASMGVGYQMQDDDTSLLLDVGFGQFYGHYEMADYDAASPFAGSAANTSPSSITLGYNMPLGRKTMAYFEFVSVDADTANSDDDTTLIAAVLKYDID